MYRVFIAIFLFIPLINQAQEINPEGRFLADSIKVGYPVEYSLSVKYPRQLDIVFPDSTYDFAPFEFENKRYFPTKTDSVFSYDSAVYTFLTFEVDSVQYLQLPVFHVSGGDSIPLYASLDSMILQHVVTEMPDTAQVENIPLKDFTDYLPISLQFNYPYLIIGIIILAILVLLVIIIFGKSIKRWWKLRKIKRQYISFQSRYHKLLQDQNLQPKEKALQVEVVWKNYMEKLTGKPYAKLTTKEIAAFTSSDTLQKALREIDRLIYSGKTMEVNESYTVLEDYTAQTYQKRVEGLKNE